MMPVRLLLAIQCSRRSRTGPAHRGAPATAQARSGILNAEQNDKQNNITESSKPGDDFMPSDHQYLPRLSFENPFLQPSSF